MEVLETFAEVRNRHRGTVGLVPTMGSLHEGHRSLLERARREADHLVASIFVNPTQFNDPADLSRYPRPIEEDLAMCAEENVDVVLLPPVSEVYPSPPRTQVLVTEVTNGMEGFHRPGHFSGVALIVTKLLAGIQPDLAYFGRKDAQQLSVVRTLTTDLSLPVTIVPCRTVREPDGLALSSRNVFLEGGDRTRAVELSRGLFAAADLVEHGETRAAVIEETARSEMKHVDEIDYVELATQDRAELVSDLGDTPTFLAVAAWVGETRLIDNVAFDIVDGQVVTDRGVRMPAT